MSHHSWPRCIARSSTLLSVVAPGGIEIRRQRFEYVCDDRLGRPKFGEKLVSGEAIAFGIDWLRGLSERGQDVTASAIFLMHPVPGRPFSYGAAAIGVWFQVVAALATPTGFPSLT